MKLTTILTAASVSLLAGGFVLDAPAQSGGSGVSAPRTFHVSGDPRRTTLAQLMRPISTELEGARLQDVIQFLSDFSGAQIDAKWLDEGNGEGLDPDYEVTISVTNVETLTLIERILERAQADSFEENGWQLSRDGFLEIGPKSVLNRRKTLVVYDINDLLFQIPNFGNVPSLDLDSILDQGQQGGGGGGGSSFFDDDQDTGAAEGMSAEELAQQIMDLITELVEPEQWVDNGGEGATMTLYQGTLLIKAPDYIHRQINGYDFWPSSAANSAPGSRYLSFGLGLQTSEGQFRNAQTFGGTGGGTGTGGTP